MPWPGPHLIFSIHTSVEPGPMEMQSSPVLMVDPVIVTKLDIWIWIPSVLGLSPGAVMVAPCSVMPLLAKMDMWKSSLLTSLMPLNKRFFDCPIVNDCSNSRHDHSLAFVYSSSTGSLRV